VCGVAFSACQMPLAGRASCSAKDTLGKYTHLQSFVYRLGQLFYLDSKIPKFISIIVLNFLSLYAYISYVQLRSMPAAVPLLLGRTFDVTCAAFQARRGSSWRPDAQKHSEACGEPDTSNHFDTDVSVVLACTARSGLRYPQNI
jgi:hypothetical protein